MLEHVKKPKGLSKLAKQEARTAYLLLIPAFLGLSLLTYIPLLAVFVIGFFRWSAASVSPPVFIGFANYIQLFTSDPFFTDSIRVTVIFSLMAVAGSLVYSLFIAMILNRKIPARTFWRAVFYLPYILPSVAVYVGWMWLYESNFGLFNYILSELGFNKIAFLINSRSVLPSLALISVWMSGNLIVIFLAGLQNVPRIYHEAAEVDGANWWQRFRNVTIPCMTPIIFYNLLMSLITNMQIIVPALAVTEGGPGNSSMFMTYLMYRTAFRRGNIGYGSAMAFVFFIIIAVFTAILFATSKSWIFYEGDAK